MLYCNTLNYWQWRSVWESNILNIISLFIILLLYMCFIATLWTIDKDEVSGMQIDSYNLVMSSCLSERKILGKQKNLNSFGSDSFSRWLLLSRGTWENNWSGFWVTFSRKHAFKTCALLQHLLTIAKCLELKYIIRILFNCLALYRYTTCFNPAFWIIDKREQECDANTYLNYYKTTALPTPCSGSS